MGHLAISAPRIAALPRTAQRSFHLNAHLGSGQPLPHKKKKNGPEPFPAQALVSSSISR